MSGPRTPLAVLLLLVLVSPAGAQTAANPSGHWEGSVPVPGMNVPIEFDLAIAGGKLTGTFGQPAQKLRGLPLSSVELDGRIITIALPSGSKLRGEISGDSRSISGDLVSTTVGTVPVTLTRTGDATIEAAPKSPAIGKELEGTWTGTLETDGGLQIVLKMANQPDGTSAGTLASPNLGPMEIPVAITQSGTRFSLDAKMIGSSFAATLNDAKTELAGTFTTGQGVELPLTLTRGAARD